MKKYRKKPVVIEATQWKNHNDNFEGRCDCSDKPLPHIHTLEGVMVPNVGDYIIKGIKGEIYSCRKYIFEATYEEL